MTKCIMATNPSNIIIHKIALSEYLDSIVTHYVDYVGIVVTQSCQQPSHCLKSNI